MTAIENLTLFIVGPARTGTSTLFFAARTVLDLPGRGESHTIPMIQRMIHAAREYYEQLSRGPEDILIREFNLAELEQLIFGYVREFFSTTYGSRWVDKTPTTEAIYGIGLLKQVFPDPKIICTKRNGLELVRSRKRKFGQTIAEAGGDWVASIDGYQRFAANDQSIFKCDQNDLLRSPLKTGRKMAEWLGVPDKSMELGRFFATNQVEKSFEYSKETLRLAALEWTDEEKQQFETICGPTMREHGYEY